MGWKKTGNKKVDTLRAKVNGISEDELEEREQSSSEGTTQTYYRTGNSSVDSLRARVNGLSVSQLAERPSVSKSSSGRNDGATRRHYGQTAGAQDGGITAQANRTRNSMDVYADELEKLGNYFNTTDRATANASEWNRNVKQYNDSYSKYSQYLDEWNNNFTEDAAKAQYDSASARTKELEDELKGMEVTHRGVFGTSGSVTTYSDPERAKEIQAELAQTRDTASGYYGLVQTYDQMHTNEKMATWDEKAENDKAALSVEEAQADYDAKQQAVQDFGATRYSANIPAEEWNAQYNALVQEAGKAGKVLDDAKAAQGETRDFGERAHNYQYLMGNAETYNAIAQSGALDSYRGHNVGKEANQAVTESSDVQEMENLSKLNGMTQHMTEDEIATYYYLADREGADAAADYLTYMTYVTDERAQGKIQDWWQNAARVDGDAGALASSLVSIPANLASGVGTIDLAVQRLGKKITGDETPLNFNTMWQTPYTVSSTIRGTVSNDLNRIVGTLPDDMPIVGGQGLGELYQLVMSAADSAAAGALTSGAGALIGGASAGAAAATASKAVSGSAAVLLGGSAATSAMQQAHAMGASDKEAFTYGLLSGTFETLFEYVSLDHLLSETTPANLTETVKSLLAQAGVEASEEFCTTVANTLVSEPVLGDLSDFNQKVQGYIAQGYSETDAKRMASADIVDGALSDALGGFLSGGMMSAGYTGINYAAANSYGRGLSQNGVTYDALLDEVQNLQVSEDMPSSRVRAIEEAKAFAEKIADGTYPQSQANMARMSDLYNAASGSVFATADMVESNRARQEEAQESAEEMPERILQAAQEYRKAGTVTEAEAQSLQQDEASLSYLVEHGLSTEEGDFRQQAAKILSEVQQSKKTADTAQSSIQAVHVQSGKITLQVETQDGPQRVSLNDTQMSDELKEHIENAAEYGSAATAYFKGIKEGQSTGQYKAGFEVAYQLGKEGVPESLVDSFESARYLLPSQRALAYSLGRQAGGVVNAARVRGGKGVVTTGSFTYGGTQYEGVSEAELADPKVAASIRVMTRLAETYGFNVKFFESQADETGAYQGENGFYANGTVYLDVHAGKETSSASVTEVGILRTAGHELTHYLRELSPEVYRELQNFVAEHIYQQTGGNLDAMVRAKQQQYYRQMHKELAFADALEEVVADGCEMVLADENLVQRMQQENKGLWEKIKAWVKEFIADLKEIIKGLEPKSVEAQLMQDSIDQLRDIWFRGLTQQGNENAAQKRGGRKLSPRGTSALNRTYSYEELTRHAPITVVQILETQARSRDAIVDAGIQNAKENAAEINSFGTPLVYVEDLGMNVTVGRSALRHGLDRRTEIQGDAVANIGSILKNSVVVNEADPKRANMANTFITIGVGELPDGGRLYVRCVINQSTMQVDEVSSLYAAYAKKQEAPASTRRSTTYVLPNASDITVAEMLDAVKEKFSDSLSDDVMQRLGAERNGTEITERLRFSLRSDEESVAEDKNGNPVAYSDGNGHVKLSLRTYEESGRETLENYLEREVSLGNLTQTDADEIRSGVEEIYRTVQEFKGKYAPFGAWSEAEVVSDANGNPVFSVVKANGEYAMNLDFSLVCKKRRTLDAVLNELVRRGAFDRVNLGKEGIVGVNEIIRRHGFEAACDMCFVDAKRYRQADVAKSFVNAFNKLVRTLVPRSEWSEISHFNYAGDESIQESRGITERTDLDFSAIDRIIDKAEHGGSKNTNYWIAKYLKENPEGRKLADAGDFMSSKGFEQVYIHNPDLMSLYNKKKGSAGPKAAFGDVQYLNDVLDKRWSREKAYDVGGVRVQSFSDYVPRMVFDYVQMMGDLAAKRLPAHAYTKEQLFVKQFGLTGMKINMSLIPAVADGGIAAGLDANGDYVWAKESFDFDTAMEIEQADGYTDNCGTICVGVSDEHIRKLLADPRIRMVIPYHKSGLNPIVAKMRNIGGFTDYTLQQNTRYQEGAKWTKLAAKDDTFNFTQELNRSGDDPRAVAERYVRWCEENGYKPKFDQFAYELRDGVIVVDENGQRRVDENYYKLLTDFTVYNESGAYVPQGDVKAVFPGEGSTFGAMGTLVEQGLEEDAILEGKRSVEVSAIADEVEQELGKEKNPDIRFSLRDSDGRELSEGQAAYFRDSKVRDEDGNLLVMYHGRVSEFTVFDRAFSNPEGDMGAGFYFTNRLDDAESNYGSRDGADLTQKIDMLAEQLYDDGEYDSYEEAQEAAAERYITAEPNTLETYLDVKNPVVLGGEDATRFTYEEEYDEETDEYGEPEGLMAEYMQALQAVVGEGDYSEDTVDLSALIDIAYEEPTAEDVIRVTKEEVLPYIEDMDGKLVSSEVIRLALEQMGFDGIIDHTVSSKWGADSGRNQAMEGVDADTFHCIVFNSNQIKRTDNLNPTENPDIRFSLRETEDGTRFVQIDVDQERFDGLTLEEMMREARKVILERFRGRVVGVDYKAYVDRRSAEEFSHPANRRMDKAVKSDKMRASTELDHLIESGTYLRNETQDGHHPEATGGIDKISVRYVVADRAYEGEASIIVTDRGRRFHDITKIKDITQREVGQAMLNTAAKTPSNVSTTDYATERGNVKTRFSLRGTEHSEAAQKEIDRLKKQVARWKRETQVTRRAEVRESDVRRTAQELMNTYGAEVTPEELEAQIKTFAELLFNRDEKALDAAYQAGVLVAESATETWQDETAAEIADRIKRSTLYLAPENRADAAGGENWSDFTRRNRKNVKFTNNQNALPVDVAYQEFQADYGEGYFPADVTRPGEQAQYLAEFAENHPAETYPLFRSAEDIDGEAANIAAMLVGAALGTQTEDGLTAQLRKKADTFADKAKKRLEAERAKGRAAVQEARAEGRQAVQETRKKLQEEKREAVQQAKDQGIRRTERDTRSTLMQELEKRGINTVGSTIAEQNNLKQWQAKYEELRQLRNMQRIERKTLRESEGDERVRSKNRIDILDAQIQRVEAALQSVEKQERMQKVIRRTIQAVEQQEAEERRRAVKEVQTRQSNRKLRERIIKHTDALSKRLLQPTDAKHVPETLRGAAAKMLDAINLEAERGGKPTKRAEAFMELRKQYQDILENGDLVIDPDLMEHLDAVAEMRSVQLDQMTAEQLQTVWEAIRAVEKSITSAGKALSGAQYGRISDWAEAYQTETEGRKAKRSITPGHFMLNMETPITFFSHFGEAGEQTYRMLRDAQDHQQVMTDEMRGQVETALGENPQKVIREMRRDVKTFRLDKERTLTLNAAQRANLYNLAQREAGKRHILGGGIVQPEVEVWTGKRKHTIRRGTNSVHLNEAELNQILSSLTDEQIETAKKLQGLTKTLAEWGNEASMAAYGYRKFTDPNYWKITAAREQTQKSVENQPERPASIKNVASAKSLVPEASNGIECGDVFDVFARSSAEMIAYSAWLIPMEDVNRLYNFNYTAAAARKAAWENGTTFNEEKANLPTTETFSGLLKQVAGDGADEYWERLMEDIQTGIGGKSDESVSGYVQKLFGNAKAASVGGNIRVVVQQPTAIFRAMAVMSPRDLSRGIAGGAEKGNGWRKAVAYSPIAARKAAGGFDISRGRQMGEALYGTSKVTDKISNALAVGAEKADAITWGYLWNACERSVAAKTKLEPGSDAFHEAVNRMFTEVIDQTQVVDGVLQRSQAMRSKNPLVKYMTAFMGEPTMSLNLMMRSTDQLLYQTDGAKRKAAGKVMIRSAAALVATSVINGVVKSLIDAMRDDDKDKEYWEKWWNSFRGIDPDEESAFKNIMGILFDGNALSDINPLQQIPLVKDIVSIAQGYDVTRMDMDAVSDAYSAVMDFFSALSGDSKKTVPYALERMLAQVGKMAGLSFGNIARDSWALMRTVVSGTDNYYLEYQMEKAIRSTGNTSNRSQFWNILYRALEGDESQYNRIREEMLSSGTFTEKDIADAMLKKIKNAYADGTLDYDRAIDLYTRVYIPDEKETEEEVENAAYFKFLELEDRETYKAEHGDTDGFTSSDYRRLYDALENGGDVAGEMDDLIEHGYSEDKVQKQVASKVGELYREDQSISESEAERLLKEYADYEAEDADAKVREWSCFVETGYTISELDDAYLDGELTENQVKNYLQKYDDLTSDGLEDHMAMLRLKKENPGYEGDLTSSQADVWYSEIRGTGMSLEQYAAALEFNRTAHADLDENGEAISGSKKAKILEWISRQNLTSSQKDALYLTVFGYAPSTLNDTPWH